MGDGRERLKQSSVSTGRRRLFAFPCSVSTDKKRIKGVAQISREKGGDTVFTVCIGSMGRNTRSPLWRELERTLY